MDFMRLLLKINYYVAMSPKYDWENRRVIRVWWHAYLCIVLSTASIIVSIVCNYLSPLNWRFNVRWPEIFMQIAYLFLQAVFAAINAISPVLHFSEWGKMVNKLQVVDDILQIRKTRMDRFEPWIFVVYIIFIAEFKTFAVVLYIKFVSWEGYKHLVVFSFINLYYSHALFFMIHFNRVIRTALMTINKKLLVLSPCNKNTNEIYQVGIGTHRTETSVINNVKDLKEAYKALNDVVICYNKIFGSRLFLTLTFAFMYMLDQMALAVLIPRLGTPTFNKHFGLDLRIKNVISLILTVFLPVAVVLFCDFTKQEGRKVTDTCNKLESKFPRNSQERKVILQLAKLSATEYPRFSAAGFFEVNKTNIFAIAFALTTYVIVVVEFIFSTE